MEDTTYKMFYDAPIGKMIIVSNGVSLIEIDHVNHEELMTSNPDELCQLATKQLDEYFASQRTEFDLPLRAIKGTDFQKAAWQALTTIPYGETISYGEQAKRMDNPKAVRAVGGANGTLTGYTGGMNRKEWLLDFERSILTQASK